ncbi:MAG TPA: glycosyltransferase family 39 protein [Solirubrobacteraceae bacterium]|jgi:4-amino-4-deoxy-L-arabinose transferase-like glycosyltransferase|nr:glycosyltransferase family 39 protein [Solirubrobacteraceae bacterium]
MSSQHPATLPSAREPPATDDRRASPIERLTRFRPGPHHLALLAVLALAAVLDVHRLRQNGYGNIFYSAGVSSMLRSWHNFFFVSFDPGGLITVDKPPLALWLQAASAKLFGFSSLSVLLPEAIVGVLSVALLYRTLARRIGGWAAVAGALALAVFPSFVAISRTNNVDALLIVLMILACDAALRACESGRWRTLLWSGALVGLAFNTKTLAAYLIVPGIALGYLLCAPGSARRRLLQLVAAGLVMVVVSGAWMLAVELTPAAQRPFVGSSTNNTEVGLTFSYNGFGRVGGQTGGPGQIPVGTGGVARTVAPARQPTGGSTKTHIVAATPEKSEFLPNGRERNPIAFGGAVGPLRLFGRGLGDQGAWMLPFALAGLIAFALLALWPEREPAPGPQRNDPQDAAGARAGEPDRRMRQPSFGGRSRWRPVFDRSRLAILIVLGGWFLAEATVLSLSKGIVHPYYVSALGPGVAAMVGLGAYAFERFARSRDWRVLIVLAAVAATLPVQLSLLHKAHYMAWFTAPLILAAAAGLLVLALGTLLARRASGIAFIGLAIALGALLVAPAVYSASNWLAPVQSTFPAAGPRAAAGPGGYGVDAKHVAVDRALLRYVESYGAGSRWSVLADASNTASPMILLGGDAGSLGGFSGTDPALSGAGLARLVSRREARYVILGGEFSTRGGNGATAAVQRVCRVVHTRTWLPRPLSADGLILFDCAGRVRRLTQA